MEEYKGINPLRATEKVRRFLYREAINCDDLVMPLLIQPNDELDNNLIPTVKIKDVGKRAKLLFEDGIKSVKIFGKGIKRSSNAAEALDKDNLLIRAITEIKNSVPNICIVTETCLCPYTHNKACVLYVDQKVDKLNTNRLFSEMAALHAESGADIIGPASMAEGTVANVRHALDDCGFQHIPIMPHLIINSNLYNLYRKAMDTNNDFRHSLQVPYHDSQQIIQSANSMIFEGADMIMIEPCIFALDIIRDIKAITNKPIGTFSVSGEYQMLYSNFSNDESFRNKLILEFFSSVKRSGANFIVTYLAHDIAKILR